MAGLGRVWGEKRVPPNMDTLSTRRRRWNRLSAFVQRRLPSTKRWSGRSVDGISHLRMGVEMSRVSLADPPRVRTSLGWVEGKWVPADGANRAKAFLGIPFAKPPLGSLRFQVSLVYFYLQFILFFVTIFKNLNIYANLEAATSRSLGWRPHV